MDTFQFLNCCSATVIYVFILSLSLVNAASKFTKYQRFADTRRLPISLAQLETKSLPQCAIFCEHEPECRAVNYNSAEERCELNEHYPEIVEIITDNDGGENAEHLTMEQVSNWAIFYKPNPSCDFEFTVLLASETVRTMTSPNYPNNYENNENRSWLFVKPSQTSTLYLQFLDFRVSASSGDCVYDYVDIFDGTCKDAPVYARFCGEETEQIVDTSGIYVLLNLVSNDHSPFRGFNMTYYIG